MIAFVEPLLDGLLRTFVLGILMFLNQLLQHLEPIDPPLEFGLVQNFNLRLDANKRQTKT